MAENTHGPIDIVIHSANVIQGKMFLNMSEVDASKTMAVNAESHFWLLKEILPGMIDRNQGHIVNISSIFAQTGYPGMTDFCASKFASYGFHEALRLEMKHLKKNIDFTTVCPPFVNSGKFGGAECSKTIPLWNLYWVADRVIQAM